MTMTILDPAIFPAQLGSKGLAATTVNAVGTNAVTLAGVAGLLPGMGLVLATPGLAVPAISAGSFAKTGGTLAPAATHAYRVSALSSSGETVPSAERVISIPSGLVPPVPTSAATSSYTGGTIAAGTVLSYRVSAVNAQGETLASQAISATAPPFLAAPSIPNTQVPLQASVAYGHAQNGGFRPALTLYYKVTAVDAQGETTPGPEYTATIPGIGYTAGTTTAINATGSQSFTITASSGVLTNISNGDAIQFGAATNIEIATLTAWNSGTGVGSATFTKTHTTDLAVSNAVYSVSLFWNNSTGATSYNIYRAGTTTAAGVSGAEGLISNRPNGNVGGGLFDGGSVAPGVAPPITDTSSTNTQQVTVSWVAVSGAATYNIYGRSSGSELKIGSTAGTSFIDTGTVTPAGALPAGDTTQTLTNSITISWGAVTGETGGFNVYGRTAGGEALLTHIAHGAARTYIDTGSDVPSTMPPVEDTSMLPPERRTVLGVVGSVVSLSGQPDASRTLAYYDVTTGDGTGATGVLGQNIGAIAQMVYDGLTARYTATRAASQDGVPASSVALAAAGAVNALGGIDRVKGRSGAAMVIPGSVPAASTNHRLNVTVADASYPALPTTTAVTYPTGAIALAQGQSRVSLDVTLTNPAGAAATVSVLPLFWNDRLAAWSASPIGQTVTLATGTTTTQRLRMDYPDTGYVFIAIAQLTANCSASIEAVVA